ncbi:hypothetical protein R3P38DRAFT_3448052 [Favolaschia claudopus]|uniref:Diacylglycerol O-acyltransferase n=1 Tax=Favolaschia claudopus TaxID=2862362 RepID=A0AAW0CQL2_9AGAR
MAVVRETLRGADRWFVGQRHAMGFLSVDLSSRLSLPTLTALASQRLLPIPRLSQRIVALPNQAPHFETCPAVDLKAHIREQHVNSEEELRSVLDDKMSTPVDLDGGDRPPWDITLLQRGDGKGSMLFWRVHHGVADAASITTLLEQLADPEATSSSSSSSTPTPPPKPKTASKAGIISNILDFVRNAVPPLAPLYSLKRAHPARLTSLASLQNPPTLPTLKSIARRNGGGTLNDVLVAAVSGALRRYMLAHNDDPSSIPVMAGIAVGGTRPPPTKANIVTLGNFFGFVTIRLPTHLSTVAARYADVRTTMDRVKKGWRGRIGEVSYNLAGYMSPARRQKALDDGRAREVTTIITNITGPAKTLFIGGLEVVDLRMHASVWQTIGVMVAAYSYRGKVNVSISADRELVKPEEICRGVESEVEDMLKA